jgi:hypothetical protein
VDFAIDAGLAHTPCNQLGVLGTEIQYQDPVCMDVVSGGQGSASKQFTAEMQRTRRKYQKKYAEMQTRDAVDSLKVVHS